MKTFPKCPREFSHNSDHGSHYHILSTGRSFYAYQSVVGIGEDLEAFTGWDNHLLSHATRDKEGTLRFPMLDEGDKLTPEELTEVADVMIARWERFKAKVERNRND